jgi:hypothetical protein
MQRAWWGHVFMEGLGQLATPPIPERQQHIYSLIPKTQFRRLTSQVVSSVDLGERFFCLVVNSE